MKFNENNVVLTAEREKVGQLEQLVIDPSTKEVEKIVVDPKVSPFKKKKVIPVSSIASTGEGEILLDSNVSDLSRFPDYKEEHFVALAVKDQEEFGYKSQMPMLLGYNPHSVPGESPLPRYFRETEKNIPGDTVPLEIGAPVISADGDHVGDIETIQTDLDSDRVSHFVISIGVLLKDKKLVPATWVDRIEDGEVHLHVGNEIIDRLPEFAE